MRNRSLVKIKPRNSLAVADIKPAFAVWDMHETTGATISGRGNVTIPDLDIIEDTNSLLQGGGWIGIDSGDSDLGDDYIRQQVYSASLRDLARWDDLGQAARGCWILAFCFRQSGTPADWEMPVSFGRDPGGDANDTGYWFVRQEGAGTMSLVVRDQAGTQTVILTRSASEYTNWTNGAEHCVMYVLDFSGDTGQTYYDGSETSVGSDIALSGTLNMTQLPAIGTVADEQLLIFARHTAFTITSIIGIEGARTFQMHRLMMLKSQSDCTSYLARLSKQLWAGTRDLPPVLWEMPA